MSIKIKRAYDPPAKTDGVRVLVDHMWPRGVRKDKAAIADWIRGISPSNELRKWYNHDPEKWPEFRDRYFKELNGKEPLVRKLISMTNGNPLTLVYATRETRYNNAAALKEYLEQRTESDGTASA